MSKSQSAEEALKKLARAGKRMRQLQLCYYAQRRANNPGAGETLVASKRAEREFDELVEVALGGRTPDLFDVDPPTKEATTP